MPLVVSFLYIFHIHFEVVLAVCGFAGVVYSRCAQASLWIATGTPKQNKNLNSFFAFFFFSFFSPLNKWNINTDQKSVLRQLNCATKLCIMQNGLKSYFCGFKPNCSPLNWITNINLLETYHSKADYDAYIAVMHRWCLHHQLMWP